MFIPGPKKQKSGGKLALTFLVATNFTKLKIISFLNRYRKQLKPIDKELKYTFISLNLGPGSGIRKTYPGSGYWDRIQRKTWCIGPYAGVDYNPTLCRFQHMYHGQPYTKVYCILQSGTWIWLVIHWWSLYKIRDPGRGVQILTTVKNPHKARPRLEKD